MARTKIITQKLRTEVELLNRHFRILDAMVKIDKPIGILRLSELLNMSPHKIRYSLRVLEHHGLIRPTAHGAVVEENIVDFMEEMISVLGEIQEDMAEVYKKVQKLRD